VLLLVLLRRRCGVATTPAGGGDLYCQRCPLGCCRQLTLACVAAVVAAVAGSRGGSLGRLVMHSAASELHLRR
jgi:hypothetical protein